MAAIGGSISATGATGAELSTPMSFDPLAPGLSFSDPDGNPALLLPAADGTTITVTQDPASYAADVAVGGEKGALVVLPHNDTATGRGQSVPIAPSATVSPVEAPPAG